MRPWLSRLLFNVWYWLPSRPPWDTGISPPELAAELDTWPSPPGRALDLGCGTGTNVVYLATRGWRAVGVDFAGRAIRAARAKAKASGVSDRCAFHVADVTDLSWLEPPFDLALDMGCLHGLDRAARERYAAGLARLLRRGGRYLLYGFHAGARAGVSGLETQDVRATFGASFRLLAVAEGGRDSPPSAWYTLERN